MENEKRLIDANAVDYENIMCSLSQLHWLNAIIEKQPTVDAVEVVHGRWKNKQTNSIFTWRIECSVCGAEYNTTVGYNYCPNCGAKMDG